MACLSITTSALSVSSLKPKPEKENKIRHRLAKVKAVRTAWPKNPKFFIDANIIIIWLHSKKAILSPVI